MIDLAPRYRRAAAEYAFHGSTKETAVCMSVSNQYVKRLLQEARIAAGVQTTFELLAVLGWLHVPELGGHRQRSAA